MANGTNIQKTCQPDDQYRHFMIVVRGSQSHINPARYLAYRLLSIMPTCHVTVSTAVSSHQRIFPCIPVPDQEVNIRRVSFIPYSDGSDVSSSALDRAERRRRGAMIGSKSLSAVLDRLAEQGRRVTCIIQALFLPWVVDVALAYGIPSILYWIQPATGLSIYYHYFNGYDSTILSRKDDQDVTVSFPGLSPLKLRDLPSFTTITSDDHPHYTILDEFRAIFKSLDCVKGATGSKPKILINSFEALEADVVVSMERYFELYTIGPLIQPSAKEEEEKNSEIFKMDDETKHMEWLDSKPERSVVYVSFGGLTAVSKAQLEEVQSGLKDSGFPYIWVVRKDSRAEGLVLEEHGSNGIIVEWCDQVKVLSHSSVGCFVTHHGWNSTLESFMCGVPMVGIPQWSDQPTCAKLSGEIGVGVRGEANADGVVLASEIQRCLKLVMSDDAKGTDMRQKAQMWKQKVREAMETGSSSEKNLRAFVTAIANAESV